MRTIAIAMIATLAGCATAAPETPIAAVSPPGCPCASPKEPAAPALAGPSPATTATRAYRRAEKTIAPAVTSGNASAGYIRAVDRADKLAREALRLLVSQDGHPTPAAIGDARTRLDDLIKTLDTP